MHSTLFNVNKSLPIERNKPGYLPAENIPSEYRDLLIPAAGLYFRQDAECDILSQHLVLDPYSVWLHDILAKDNILLRTHTPLPVFILQFMFEDSLPLPRAGFTLEERECSCFYLHPGPLHRIPMSSDKKIFSFHINIQPMAMANLVRQYPSLQCLMTGVHPNVTSRINTRPYHINAVSDMLIRKIMTCRYTGNNAKVFLRRCVTDIMLNFASQHEDSRQPFLFSSMVHAATLNNIFSFLADHPHKTHSLPELAYMYDLPLEELHHGFRQHFAMPVPEYMHMLKMMMIWHLVQTNSFPIKDVVVVTGYKSQEDMLADLKNYYGALPE